MTSATVFLVEDDRAMRESVCDVLNSVGYRVAQFGSAEEFLELDAIPVREVSCLVADVCLPAVSGVEMRQCLAQRGISLPTVFMTGYDDVPLTVTAMKDGAIDFLRKPIAPRQLLDAVRQALTRSAYALADAHAARDLRTRLRRLTRREREVLDLVRRGFLNKQIAAQLGVSMATVKAHRGRVTRKLAVESVADLIRVADRAVRVDESLPWSNGDQSSSDLAYA